MSPDPRAREVLAKELAWRRLGVAVDEPTPMDYYDADAILAALDAAGYSVVQLERVSVDLASGARWKFDTTERVGDRSLPVYRVVAGRSPINEDAEEPE